MLDKDASIEYNIINLQVDNLPVDQIAWEKKHVCRKRI